ncbi:MAG: hypothetical protein AB7F89_05625 [Pirellulaceae bacterium]
MRSMYVLTCGAYLSCALAAIYRFQAAHRQLVLVVGSLLMALCLTSGVQADDPPKPKIQDFEAFFDGFELYALVGQVFGVPEPELENCEVHFGGPFAGHSTTTDPWGYFYLEVFHEECTGAIATARAKTAAGVWGDSLWLEVF